MIINRPKLLHRSRSRGQAVVEFAIIAPLMFLMLLIAIDFGRLFFTYIAINNAAREGAAFGSLSPSDCGGSPCLATSGIATHASQETNTQARGGKANAIIVDATCARPGGTPRRASGKRHTGTRAAPDSSGRT